MKSWPVQDAQDHFDELLEACLTDGPQVLTRRGADTAVLVPMQEWRRLHPAAEPASLKELLLSEAGRSDLLIPPRGQAHRRPIEPAN